MLERNGWSKVRQAGSHAVFVRQGFRSIVVPIHPGKDIPPGTVRAILKVAGIRKT